MKESEMPFVPKSGEKRPKSTPKIIKLAPQSVNEDVIFFKRQCYYLRDTLDRVDRAGAAIGEEDSHFNW